MKRILPWIIPVLILLVWHLGATWGWISSRTLPAPLDVLKAFVKLVKSGELFEHMQVSFERAMTGFAIGGGIGFLLGLINGMFPIASRLLDSTVQMIRNIPHLALIPLVILWFGVGEEAKVFLVALGVMFPIYINTYHGIRQVDGRYIEMAKVYGLNTRELFWHVILPGALPSIFVGLRFALGFMWLTLIVAETIAANAGIGYMAMNAREFMQTDVVVLGILLYALLGKGADIIAHLFEKSFLKWHPNFQKGRV
jgi:sulfonate transport system permease protein